MLQAIDHSVNPDIMPPEFRSPAESLAEGVAFIRRRLSIILVTCSVTFGIGLFYLIAAAPTFTANVQLIVDSQKTAQEDAGLVSTNVESQIAIIKSEGIARAVIRELGLAEEFGGHVGVVRGMVRSISRLLGWRKPETESSVMQNAVESFERKLSAKRVGVTYIINVSFDFTDPDRAAQILNTVAETYIAAQMDAKYSSSLRSEKWIKDRLSQLSSQAADAQKAVANYHKNRNNVADSAEPVDPGTSLSQLTKTQGDLRELEATGETTARTYDNFLRALRYTEAQRQATPVFEARAHLLTGASPPLQASSPRAALVLGISAVGGVLLGIAFGMLRDLLDRGVRTLGDRTTVSPVVVLQQGEATLASPNSTSAPSSSLRRQSPREEPGALAARATRD
ncbi:hypothetical protein IVA95_04815 [Bradyrhizobium sp. 157]|uniref:GumC family protein n=1 Tax=Bradyrhizobium sp. 157 TaxID=2782631 RepID=UPI001FFA6E89|nr:Wzz/FepE/Etk N-terminal domain-containing protein [Bradyrhizobium sp. 157]MCK1636921.1 hypothetical protein [Bradyrhizobium sp. 157]